MSDRSGLSTAISEAHPDHVVVRGLDLCRDLIGKVGFTEYFLLMLTGERPSPQLVALTDAAMVSIAEHGFTPSVQAARMTLFAEPDSLQGAVAAGILGCGSVILGASEVAGRLLAEIANDAEAGADLDDVAAERLRRLKAERRVAPGFGHPIHRQGDPRAARLVEYASELGVSGRHIAALQAIERQIATAYGRWLPTNISAAIPAVMLDAGYPLEALKAIPLLARCAALIAHLAEEKERRLGYRLAEHASEGLVYDGPPRLT